MLMRASTAATHPPSPAMTSVPVSPSRIGQIAIPARDIERAVAFYRDVLGLRFLFEAPPKLAFFDCGGIRLMLSEPEEGETFQPGSVLYYLYDNLPDAHQALVERGVTFAQTPHKVASLPDHDLWMAFLHDSEGNLIGLMSEVRR